MPCKDTTSEIYLRLDQNDRLIDFDFTKITCSKPIAGISGYQKLCVGMSAEEILELDFSSLVEELRLEETEEQFLFFLEWGSFTFVLGCLFSLNRTSLGFLGCSGVLSLFL